MYQLINIGHSRGVRIPKSFIQQAGLDIGVLEFQLLPEGLLIKPTKAKRQGWAEAFKKASIEEPDDMQTIQNQFDTEDWEWNGKFDETI